jgi:hypothetical protein
MLLLVPFLLSCIPSTDGFLPLTEQTTSTTAPSLMAISHHHRYNHHRRRCPAVPSTYITTQIGCNFIFMTSSNDRDERNGEEADHNNNYNNNNVLVVDDGKTTSTSSSSSSSPPPPSSSSENPINEEQTEPFEKKLNDDNPSFPLVSAIVATILFVSFWPVLALLRNGHLDVDMYMTLKGIFDESLPGENTILELPPISPAERLVDAIFGPP